MGAAKVLNISKNGEVIKSVPLEGEAVLGRGEGCVIRLEDRAISRQHAVFRNTVEGIQVEKKSEFAPIRLNGQDCTRALVKTGDVVSIGPYLVKIEEPVQELPAKAPSLLAVPVPSESDATLFLSSPLESKGESGGDAKGEAQGASSEAFPPASMAESAGSESSFQVPGQVPGQAPGSDFPGGSVSPLKDVGSSPGILMEPSEPSLATPTNLASINEDAATKILSPKKTVAQLSFAEGASNHTLFEMTQPEVSIGRGKDCDIVLNDKKASRRNCTISRNGLNFIIKDEGSANGTFVNGNRIQEHRLSSGDQIKIGNTPFTFKAFQRDFEEQAKDFLPVPQDDGESAPEAPYEGAEPIPGQSPHPDFAPDAGIAPDGVPGISPGISNVQTGSIAGISSPGRLPSGKRNPWEWYKAQPKQKKLLYLGAIVLLTYIYTLDDPAPKKTVSSPAVAAAKKSDTAGVKGLPTFDQLQPAQKAFVVTEHQLALEYFENKDYDKALYEIEKVLAIVSDYKEAREIERYSKDGKRKLEAIEEEKQRRDAEAKVKAQVAELVEKTRGAMEAQKYDQARAYVSEVLALDPDNTQIGEWRKKLDAIEEARVLKEQEKRVQQELNRRGWQVFNEAQGVRKAGRFQASIEIYEKVFDIGPNDKHLLESTKSAIQSAKDSIQSLRDPVLADAKQSEQSGDLPKAYQLYEKATQIDPSYPDGFDGMKRIEGTLHERAKAIYIEAVLAESYSDFATAKQKFQDCLNVAPTGDLYHERAERKLSRYFLRQSGDAPR